MALFNTYERQQPIIIFEMNSSSFLYPVPFVPQPYFNFPHFAPSAPFFILPPTYNLDQIRIPFAEAHGTAAHRIPKYPQNFDYQQTKIQQETLNRSQEIKLKRLPKPRGAKKYKIQRLRDGKGRYSGVTKLPTVPKYKQNPKRNVVTNIGNQLLAFASNKDRSLSILKRLRPEVTETELARFYEFIGEVRDRTDYYLNLTKMSEIWYPSPMDSSEQRAESRKLFRHVSQEYLNNMIRLIVLSSTKIKSSSKVHHIKAVRTLLLELRKRQL